MFIFKKTLFNYSGIPAKQAVSRGQQRLLYFALVFSQIALYEKITGDKTVLLCDDPGSELDSKHSEIFLSAIRSLNLQSFISGNSRERWNLNENDKLFHVKQGGIEILP